MLTENAPNPAEFFPALCAPETAAASPTLRLESEEQASLVEALLADSREAALILESHSGDLFDSRPIYVNPAYSRLTGQSPGEAAGERPWFLSREAASAEMRARLRAALADGLPVQREPVGGCVNSRRLQVLLSITPLTCQMSSLAPSRWLATLRDLADSDRIDAELRKLSGQARCLIWHALIEDRQGRFLWNFRIPDAETVPQWLPIAVAEGQPFSDAFIRARLPEEIDRLDRTSVAAIREGRTDYSQEFRCELASGERRWLAENVHLEILGSSRWHAIGVCIDITERKQAEQALRESRGKYQLLAESMDDIVSLHDPEGRFLYVSPSMQKITGYTVAETLGQSGYDFFHPEDRIRILEQADRQFIDKNTSLIEWRRLCKDGSYLWVETKTTRIYDEQGQLFRMVCNSRDITERKLAENERKRAQGVLAEEHNLLRTLIDSLPDYIYVKDAESRFLLSNKSHQAFLEAAHSEQAVGKTVFDFFAPEMAAHLMGEDEHVIHSGQSLIDEEEQIRDQSGPARWVSTTKVPLRDAQGAIVGLVGISRDITEQKRSEQALRDSEERFRSLVQNATDIITILEADGAVRYQSPSCERLLGYAAEEMIGANLLAVIHSDDMPRILRYFDQVLTTPGVNPPIEFRVRHRSGEWRHLESVPSNRLDDPAMRAIVVNSRDITERKQAEDALEETNATLEALIQASPLAITVVDSDNIVRMWNQAAERIFGWSEEETLGRPYPIIPADKIEEYERLRAQILRGKAFADVEKRRQRKDGSLIDVSISSAPLYDAQGRIHAILAIIADITERKAWETERERVLAEALERADCDPLTGLPNHRAFHKRLADETDKARVENAPMAIAVMDLDNFKFFNDAYGHSVGDDVLRQLSQALRACCRPGDTLARFGGDEFALLMPRTGIEEAVRLADRLVNSLTGVGYRPPDYDVVVPMSLSVGLSIFPDDGPGRLEALAAADARLMNVKSGGTGAGALTERVRAHLSSSTATFSMLNALVTAVDTKDRYTRRHSEDVMAHSLEIAQELGLDDRTQHHVLVAALLHDVGKVGVPDSILRKPGRLSVEEINAVRQHPMMGSIIVAAVPGFEETLDAIRHHHERWDGQGYPFGLCREETPLIARLMAVADAFSAMTTDRPYRKGMAPEQALQILESGAGSQWDPACVAAFLRARRKPNALFGP